MVAILKSAQNGRSEKWLSYHKNNSFISLNDSSNIDFSEIEKQAFFGGNGNKNRKKKINCFSMWRPSCMPSFKDLILINLNQKWSVDI